MTRYKMFEQFRINRLKPKIDSQRALVDKLSIAEAEYKNSYYTDKFHAEFCKLIGMQSRMKWLKNKLTR